MPLPIVQGTAEYTRRMDADMTEITSSTAEKQEKPGRFNSYWATLPERRPLSVMTTLPALSAAARRIVSVLPGATRCD